MHWITMFEIAEAIWPVEVVSVMPMTYPISPRIYRRPNATGNSAGFP
jgi:hypothetical protein